MIVEYYEASALCRIEPGATRGRRRCLNDYHRTAWRLYSGGENLRDLPERRFVFRVDELAGGRGLFTLRCDHAFPGAKARRMDIEAGQRLDLEWLYLPTVRVSRTGEGGERLSKKRRTPPKDEWPDYAAALLARNGLRVDPQALEMRTVMRLPRKRDDHFSLSVVRTRARALVSDPVLASQAWLDGLGPMRSYGFGMLAEVRDSAVAA